jgi:Outer membrane protein
MKKSIIFFATALISTFSINAQENKKWTLKDCIDYAMEKNIQLQQDKISLEQTNIDVKTAKAALFPNLSFSTSQSVVNRPYKENSSMVSGSEIISSSKKTTYNGNYGLNSQMILWNGNKNFNNIKQQKINRQIAGLNINQTENSLQEQITQLFIQILYANESVKINQNTVQVSSTQYERGKELLKAGSLSKADVAQLAAQLSSDEYQVVTAQSSLANYKLQLKQLLEIDNTQELELELPEIGDNGVANPLPDKMDIYNVALTSRPEIESGKLNIKNSDIGISMAKAGYCPTLSLNASSTTNHISSSENTFKEQLKYGWNNMIGLNLSIPIFSNREPKVP